MSSPLASAAGPIALVAGLVFAAVDVSRLLAADTSKERIAMMRETPFQVTNALYSSYVLFALGWMVFGIAGWRARMFPAWLGVAFFVAGVVGYNAALPPYGIPIGLAMAALGWWITRSTRRDVAAG